MLTLRLSISSINLAVSVDVIFGKRNVKSPDTAVYGPDEEYMLRGGRIALQVGRGCVRPAPGRRAVH